MQFSRVFTGDEPQRVNKWLAGLGVCSRREAEELIANGLVSIDGARVDDVGRKIAPGQTLVLDRAAAAGLAAQVTIVLNKPVGYVSAQPEASQIPAARLVNAANLVGPAPRDLPGARARLAPLGRLDQDSRGLLLLSEDGVLAKAVIGPESPIDKEYLVAVRGAVNGGKLALLRHGLELDGRKLRPAGVRREADGRLRFRLTEGRNRQIRRMCLAVGLEVTDLLRIRIGPVELDDLPEGHFRMLTATERERLLTFRG